MIPVEYIRIERAELEAPEVQQALEAGRAVLVHESSRYAYLRCIAPAGFGEVLGTRIDEVPEHLRTHYLRVYVRRTVEEDGQTYQIELLVPESEVLETDEVLARGVEAARFAGEDD